MVCEGDSCGVPIKLGKLFLWLLAVVVLVFAWAASTAHGQATTDSEWDRDGDRLVITAPLNSPNWSDRPNLGIYDLGKDLAIVGSPGSEAAAYLEAHASRKLILIVADAEDGQ